MKENNLNLSHALPKSAGGDARPNAMILRFDPRALCIHLLSKWKPVTIVFLASLVIFGGMMKYFSVHSNTAWTAVASIYHQTRSDRIPSFYKPVDTNTVAQFVTSRSAMTRASKRISDQFPDAGAGTFDHIELTLERSKKNIILVSASASSPKLAAALANTIAEEGISEYVRRQNDSMIAMVEERKQQRTEIEKQLASLQEQKKVFYSETNGLPPDAELVKLREELFLLSSKINELAVRKSDLEIRLKSTRDMLEKTDLNVVSEMVVDDAVAYNLRKREAELESLRRRYTDENPKVRLLIEEFNGLKDRRQTAPENESASRVVYRKNEIYTNLEMTISQFTLEHNAIDASIRLLEEQSAQKRGKIDSLLDLNKKYSVLARREATLNGKSSKLSESINEIEFLINSAIPDVSVLESAKMPSSSNIGKLHLKTLALSIITTALLILCFSAAKLLRMQMTASKEYKSALGIENFGEIPVHSDETATTHAASLQKLQSKLKTNWPSATKYLVLNFDAGDNFENDINEVMNIAATNGAKTIVIKCLPAGVSTGTAPATVAENDDIASNLLCIEKFADTGFFRLQNETYLDAAESDILRHDLNVLAQNYDIVVLEMRSDQNTANLAAQLSILCDCVLFASVFEKTSKFPLFQTIQNIRTAFQETKIGGVLTGVPKTYYKEVTI